MKFNLSINISQGVSDNFNYIVTPNAQKVYGNIVDSFQSGIHSFLIIGTYGTGKSSFLMALEQDLLNNKSKLVSERSVFADAKSFEFMNIVGDYSSLWHYKIFCVNGNTGFRNESRIFYFIHLQNEEAYERKESSSA